MFFIFDSVKNPGLTKILIMKRLLFFSLMFFGILSGCKSSKMNSKSVAAENSASLEGTWVLNYVSAPGKSVEELYAEKKPEIKFDLKEKRFSGNTSCNSFSGKLNMEDNQINFRDPYVMTKMMCPGEGENVFTETLKKVNSYSISDGNTLNFIGGDIAVMRFTRK